jgi:hypothetical protein
MKLTDIRKEFWQQLIAYCNLHEPSIAPWGGNKNEHYHYVFKNIEIHFDYTVYGRNTKTGKRFWAGICLVIESDNKRNKAIFHKISKAKEQIEADYSELKLLIWEDKEAKNIYRIKYVLTVNEEDFIARRNWSSLIRRMTSAMKLMIEAFRPYL